MVTRPAQEATVAVIDDEESMREGCRQTLNEEGYRTETAEDGELGLQLVERLKPNVVLVDLKMPGVSGMEVLKRLCHVDSDIIAIVITGYGTIESAVEAMKLGAFDYLTKPFEPEQVVEVVARGLAKQRLARQSAELEREKEAALNNFAAVVCHQLKSPAAAAAQCIDAVRTEQFGALTDEQKAMLQRADRRISNLTTVIEDWLTLAQTLAGAIDLESVDLPRVIADAWQAVAGREGLEGIDLEFKVASTTRCVRGSARLLRELFTNLLNNSVRFISPPGKITVDVSTEASQTVVSVRDTGIGIATEDVPHVFEPFYRGTRAGPRGLGGSGLGLAIVDRIASAHGGAASASSAPGRGATFTVTLPAEPDISMAPVAAPAFAAARPVPAVEVATKALDARQLSSFVEEMISDGAVVGVKSKEEAEDRFVFAPLNSASELRLDYDVTLLPPKKYLLPQRETLVRFKMGPSATVEPCVEGVEPTVLIGVHPYDMIAINQLDRLMCETNPDPNYLARRESLTIIGVDPARAGNKAFWGAMGCGVVAGGFDLWLTDVGGVYVAEVGSTKGAWLLAKYAEARGATTEELQARDEVRKKLPEIGSTREVNFRPTELPSLLRRCFAHGIWAEQARKCLSCGSCNLVCPTCYCFDVRDDVDISLTEGQRYRVWDGCVLEDFAKVGTGENFREERLQRYRHRFYRKGMYLYDKFGQIACVGCGRCATACLPDIADPVTVYNALKEGKET